MRRFLGVTALSGLMALLPSAGGAQDIVSGQIAGVVRDTSGAVLPGVTVEASSPALIERVRSAVTDGTGQYRIVGLRSGTYVLTATLTGFNTSKRENLEISGSAVVTINIDLKVGSIQETVTVSGETPVVDLQSTTRERVMSKEVVDALPTGRMYYTLGVLVPGVNSNQRDVGGVLGDQMGSLSAHGGREGDQRILQNGLNVMTLVTAGGNIGGMVPNTSAAQEVAIDSSAASAERQTGGVSVNFVPRDGGNTIRGSIFATGAFEGQQASNLTQNVKDQGLSSLSKYKQNWDFNPGVGGPILQDKLWYYYTYRNNGSRQYAAGMFYNQNEFLPANYTRVPANGTNGTSVRPALALRGDWWDSQIRLTWQANAKNKFAGTWDQQSRCTCPTAGPVAAFAATRSPEAQSDTPFRPQRLLHLEWWSPLNNKVLLEFVTLHRTERFIPGPLIPADRGGSVWVTPQLYQNYSQMVGVTQLTGDSIPGVQFHGPVGAQTNNYNASYTYRWAVSYITGAHAYKVGGQDSFGYTSGTTSLTTLAPSGTGVPLSPMTYVFSGPNTPLQVTSFQTPYAWKNELNHDFGLFVQDRWTLNRLTLNYGVRYDWFNSSTPAQYLFPSTLGRPGANFDAIENSVNWKDVTPRLGASYDFQGDGKTAIKVTLNKYIAGQGLGGLPADANPINRLVNSNQRTWIDNGAGGGVAGDLIPQCDVRSSSANGECLAAGGALWNTTTPRALVDQDIRSASDGGALWNTRGYNWEFSAGVQREILPRVSLDVSYFRRWYGNFTAVDQTQLAATDFNRVDIVVPTDSRLPGGGANTVAQFVDLKTAALAQLPPTNKVVLTDSIGAKQIERWNGVDVSVNARLRNGLLLQGGTSTGRRNTNTCDVAAMLPETLNPASPTAQSPLSFCEQTEPLLTQVKLIAAYTLPRYAMLPQTLGTVLENIQVSGTFQSIPGNQMLATYQMPNGELCQSGAATCTTTGGTSTLATWYSDLAGTTPIAAKYLANTASATSTKNINLIEPSTVFDARQNQLDLRVGRILRFGRTRATVNLDIFNVFNEDTVLSRNNNFAKTNGYNATTGIGINNQTNTVWVPTGVLQARFYKVSATFDF